MKIKLLNTIKTGVIIVFCVFFFSGCSVLQNMFSFEQPEKNTSLVQPGADDADTRYRLARHFQKNGRHMLAVEELKKIIQMDHNNFNAYNALGVSYDRLRKFSLAADAYKAALNINPDLDYVYNNMGYSNLLQNNLKQASASFQAAIALNSQNRLYRNNFALVKARQERDTKIAESKPGFQEDIQNPLMASSLILPGKENHFYAIQLGVSYNIDIARIIMKKAVKKGFDYSYITRVEKENPFYRVRFGKFEKKLDADLFASKILNRFGKKGLVVHEPYPLEIYESAKTCLDAAITYSVDKKKFDIEISNGNGIYHIAERVGNYLTEKGFHVTRLTNAPHYNHEKTIIYYTPGYYQHAVNLAQEFPGFALSGRLIQTSHIRKNIKLLIGQDMASLGQKKIINSSDFANNREYQQPIFQNHGFCQSSVPIVPLLFW